MDAGAWAFTEFWGSSLGDLRLQRRIVDVAACVRENPRGTLPQAVGDSTALKAASCRDVNAFRLCSRSTP